MFKLSLSKYIKILNLKTLNINLLNEEHIIENLFNNDLDYIPYINNKIISKIFQKPNIEIDNLNNKIKNYILLKYSHNFFIKYKRFPFSKEEFPQFIQDNCINNNEFNKFHKNYSKLIYNNLENNHEIIDFINFNKNEYNKSLVLKYKTESNYYPLTNIHYRNSDNNLPRSYNKNKIDSNLDSKNFIINLFSKEFYEKFLIENETINLIENENKKFSTLTEIKEKDNTKRIILLLLYENFKNIYGKYPNYKEYEDLYKSPFVIGIDKEGTDIIYENLFRENEINDYFKEIELKSIFKNINKSLKNNNKEIKEKKEEKSKIAEHIIVKIVNNILLNSENKLINNFESFVNKDIGNNEDIFFNKFKNILNKDLLEEFNKNNKVFYFDIINIIKISFFENNKLKLNQLIFKNLNESENNSKGYDFVLTNKINKKKVLLSYKYISGRAYSNLSIYKFFRNIELDFKESDNQKEIKSFDTFVFEKHLKKIYEDTLNNVFRNIHNSEIKFDNKKKFAENVHNSFGKNYKHLVTYNDNEKKILSKLDKKEKDKLDSAIFKNIISDSLYSVLSSENINKEEEFLKNKDILKIKILKYIEKKHKYLIDYTLYNDKNSLIYKYIIKNFHRNEEIIDSFNKENKSDVEISIYNDLLKNLNNNIDKLKSNINNSEIYKKDFLKYILHLEQDTNNYLIENHKMYKMLRSSIMEKNIKDIKVDFSDFESNKSSIFFKLKILYKDKILYEFRNNKIKSKEGKFIYLNSVEISNEHTINQKLINDLNKYSNNEITLN